MEIKNRQILNLVQGVIVGKSQDEQYYEEYKEVFKNLNTPVLYNVNFEHPVRRGIIPYDIETTIDYNNRRTFINRQILEQKKIM